MSTYTELLEHEGSDIYPEDDNYTEELLEFVKKFRYFDEALTEFMSEHGYTGDIENIEEKVAFLKMKFKDADIAVPRNLNRRGNLLLCHEAQLELYRSTKVHRTSSKR